MAVGVVLLCLSSIGFGQQTIPVVPEYVPPVSFSDVLKGLGDESIHSMFDRNRDLSRAIADRGIGFGFGANAKDVLVKAGASEGLISAITNGQRKRLDEIHRLWKEYNDNRNGLGSERLQKHIALGKELRDRIGDPELLVGEERGWSGLFNYLKTSLPKKEADLERFLKTKIDQ